jgi:nitrous oxidase accessory protein
MIKILLLLISLISALTANILQETIDNAPLGATLKLSAGIYSGNITINKPITILGKEDGVIIDGGGVGKVITINSSNVILKNLTIKNSGTQMYNLDSAIFINKSKNSEISNCKILNSLYGIDMLMVEDSIISNNFITSYSNDISLRGDALKIWHSNNNIISNNTIDKVRDVTLNYSNNNKIVDNLVTNSRFAMSINYSKNNFVKENIFKYNSVSLMLMMAKDTKIINNSMLSSKGAAGIGIMIKGGDQLLFDNNSIKYNANAFYIDSALKETGMKRYILNNDISYNKEALHFHLTIRNNTFSNNSFVGNIDDVVKSAASFETRSNVVEYNYWDRYAGFDTNGDNIGDTSHKMYQYADRLWHYNNKVKFFYASPIMALLNFLAQVAPFIDPILLLEDTKPIVKNNQ